MRGRPNKFQTLSPDFKTQLASGYIASVSIGKELGQRILDFMIANGIEDRNIAIRELLAMGVSNAPQAEIASQIRAYVAEKSKRRINQELSDFMKHLAKVLETENMLNGNQG